MFLSTSLDSIMGHVLPVLGLYLKAERVLSLGVGQGVNIYTPILIVMCLKPQASSASTQIQWFVKSVTIAAECSYAVLLNYDLSPGGGDLYNSVDYNTCTSLA